MEWLLKFGYLGLFLGTFLAGTVLPLSSDLLYLGLVMMGGNQWICLIAATLGNTCGSMVTYSLGWFAKWEWLTRWFKVDRSTLEKHRSRVKKYGVWLAFFCWAPVIGNISMVTLGFYKVSPKLTAILVFTGCLVRFLFWNILLEFYDISALGDRIFKK